MASDLKKGDKVSWKSHGGTAHGEVERKVTHDTKVKDHTVRADAAAPQYIVRSDKGGEAAHKRAALKKA